MNNHGGYRPGSGRKSNKQIHDLRNLIDDQIPETVWRVLITALVNEAGKGNTRAIQLLFLYRFGDPNAVEPHDEIREMLQRAFQEVLEEKRSQGSPPPKTLIEATTP